MLQLAGRANDLIKVYRKICNNWKVFFQTLGEPTLYFPEKSLNIIVRIVSGSIIIYFLVGLPFEKSSIKKTNYYIERFWDKNYKDIDLYPKKNKYYYVISDNILSKMKNCSKKSTKMYNNFYGTILPAVYKTKNNQIDKSFKPLYKMVC